MYSRAAPPFSTEEKFESLGSKHMNGTQIHTSKYVQFFQHFWSCFFSIHSSMHMYTFWSTCCTKLWSLPFQNKKKWNCFLVWKNIAAPHPAIAGFILHFWPLQLCICFYYKMKGKWWRFFLMPFEMRIPMGLQATNLRIPLTAEVFQFFQLFALKRK